MTANEVSLEQGNSAMRFYVLIVCFVKMVEVALLILSSRITCRLQESYGDKKESTLSTLLNKYLKLICRKIEFFTELMYGLFIFLVFFSSFFQFFDHFLCFFCLFEILIVVISYRICFQFIDTH